MAQIVNTMIEGLSNQMIQARLDTADARQFVFGTHFPLKKVVGFKWGMLTNQKEAVNVAGDIHADNGTIARKRRPILQLANGDIPLIAISREMKRSELKEYQTAAALARNADASALVDYWGNDIDFCFTGVNAELEYIAWAAASNAGRLAFTLGNNATFANEFDLDYQVDDSQKTNNATSWATAATATPIDDLVAAVKAAKAQGFAPKFAFMSLNTFYKFVSCAQIIKACASYVQNATGTSQVPDLASVNSMLARQAWMNGLQIVVVDIDITREQHDGTRTTANPFADDRVILSESRILGSTQYDILQENAPVILRAVRNHVVIKKYGTVEPTSEITIGQADAMPVLDTAYRNIYLKTDGSAWA